MHEVTLKRRPPRIPKTDCRILHVIMIKPKKTVKNRNLYRKKSIQKLKLGKIYVQNRNQNLVFFTACTYGRLNYFFPKT